MVRNSAVRVFDQRTTDYDAWYDTESGAAIFAAEVAALRPLLAGLPRPWLEIGVGSGRFASALGIEYGLDPARGALTLAHQRGIHVVAAWGEHLPFADATFGGVVLVVTLCFVADPLAVLREAHRVLRPDGGILLGVVPADSPLGQHYQLLASQGHPFYRTARFSTRAEVHALLDVTGFQVRHLRATLIGAGSDAPIDYEARDADDPQAGFLALLGNIIRPTP